MKHPRRVHTDGPAPRQRAKVVTHVTRRKFLHGTGVLLGGAMLARSSGQVSASPSTADIASHASSGIDHIIVIYLENHSFDNLFGTFPGAEGIRQAGAAGIQVDGQGKVFAMLPAILKAGLKVALPDERFPLLPNRPFLIDDFVANTERTRDLVHSFVEEQWQINNGKMDKFAAVSDAAGLVMGYYDGSKTQLWQYAREYVLADHFFHAAFGGSLLNHIWLVAAQTPMFPNAPESMRNNGSVTPDGYVVNTVFTVNTPHPARWNPAELLPPLTMPHIGDRLDAKGISWVWYSGGWNDALAGSPDPTFYYQTQPFAYFANLADGTAAKAQHLRDETEFVTALQGANFPNVAFVKPLSPDTQHPGEADLMRGDAHTASLIKAVQASRYWESSAIIVTYDEHGGFWDHVPPPKIDRWGPGIRVPAVIISSLAKRGFVDKTVYDTTSILRFIEWRWGLEPLTERDAKANNLTNAFIF